MLPIVCITIGALFAISTYLLLSNNLLQWLLGIVILSSSVNLIILLAGRIGVMTPAFVPAGQLEPSVAVANPLPQAMILTAIVIGFGLMIFALILIRQIWKRTGSVHSSDMDVFHE